MRILLSAFACVPHGGSEGGAGWRWAIELAREHDVVVLTDISRRAAIERSLAADPVDRLGFAYYRPTWLTRVDLNSKSANIIYSCWQLGLLSIARPLHARHRFDLVIHLTYGVFRQPCFLGALGVPFVFGPVGGGEDAPWRLKRSLGAGELTKEVLRYMANKFALVNPLLWYALSRTSVVLVRTEATRRALPVPFRRGAVLMQEIGVDAAAQGICERPDGAPLKVLFVGRLLGWKGAHLALRAVHAARQRGLDIEFTVVGRGPFGPRLQLLAQQLGLDSCITWVEHEPQAELFARMARSHVLLFPSLHDSGGNVVLEAQAQGLPVVCLDLGGPPTLVCRESAAVVAVGRRSEAEVVHSLANAVDRLAQDEHGRRRMAELAQKHARHATWSSRATMLLTLSGVYSHDVAP